MHIGLVPAPTTLDPNAWSNVDFAAPTPPGMVNPASLLAQQGVCTCVNGTCVENGNDCESSHAAGSTTPSIESILAQQGACTCVGGTCVENGNSCSTVAPAGPVGSAAYVAQQKALQDAALAAMSPSWFPGISNTTVLLGGAVVFAAFFFRGRR